MAGTLAVLSGGQTVELPLPPRIPDVSGERLGSASERAETLFVDGLSCLAPEATRDAQECGPWGS